MTHTTHTTTDLRADMVGYAHTDMLFYRSPEEVLAALERTHWDPIIAWAKERWGVNFILTEGLMPLTQPAEWEAALQEEITALPEEALREMGILTKILGSVICSLALYHKALMIDDAITAGFLEEEHQASQWGEDAEARDKRDVKKQECREAFNNLSQWERLE